MSSRRRFLHAVLAASASPAVLAAESSLTYKGENIQFGLVTYQ
jgi:hypothetical protein